jgi:hypothetical protein
MMIMTYRKENSIGFKTAKRRMLIEIQDLILFTIVVIPGGDPEKNRFMVSLKKTDWGKISIRDGHPTILYPDVGNLCV